MIFLLLLLVTQWTFAQWHNRNVPWPSPVSVRRHELSASAAAAAGKHLNWQETYAENMARFSSYHNECVHRCDEHFWRLSEWLAGVAAAASGTDVPTRPLMMPGWNAHGEWHADTKRCAETVATAEDSGAPAGHKKHKKNGNASGDAPPPPLVLPIVHGDFNWTHDGSAKNGSRRPMEMQPSVTLVLDRSSSADQRQKVILVDTGLPANRQAVLSGLLWHGIPPHRVDTVITTNPDAHSMGNLNLFPCAEIHSGIATFHANTLRPQSAPSFANNRSDLPFRSLSDNADLYLTPGISLQDQSLVVRRVHGHGTVAIVGKLVLNEEDLTSSNSAIRAFGVEDSEHRKLWQATRREIVCLADFVIPGYGVPFKVNETLKRLAECDRRKRGQKGAKGGGSEESDRPTDF